MNDLYATILAEMNSPAEDREEVFYFVYEDIRASLTQAEMLSEDSIMIEGKEKVVVVDDLGFGADGVYRVEVAIYANTADYDDELGSIMFTDQAIAEVPRVVRALVR